MRHRSQRSSLSITLAVWRALFIREVLTRFSKRRAGWIWIFLEPILLVGFVMVIWGIFRVRSIAGINPGVFTMLGVLGFLTVQKTSLRSFNAIKSNNSLFTYRQVLPIDTVLVRAVVELLIMLIAALVLMGAMYLSGFPVIPENPGLALFAFGTLWGLGLGLGLIWSAIEDILPEVQSMVELTFRPLYFFSTVHYPLAIVPFPFQGWLLWNPLVHALELLRAGFFHQLQPPPGVSAFYLVNATLLLIFLGLALHHRFYDRLVSE